MNSLKQFNPPRSARLFLRWFCKDRLLEEIEGDLFEYYQMERENRSRWLADLHYWFHLFNFLRPFALKKIGQNSNTIIMYRSYFKFAWRGMMRHKLQTSFHILGLVLAFAVCGFIYLYTSFETSYDSFHDGADDIYRIAWMNENPQTRTPHPMAQSLANDFPEVEKAVSLSPIYGPGLTKTEILLTHDKSNVSHEVSDGFFADSTFFEVFSFKTIDGDPNKALRSEWAIVLSESTAKRFFGEEDPIGQRLTFNGMVDILEVAAVVEDAPRNSHFHFNFIISYVTLKSLPFNDPWLSWDDFGHFNYVKLRAGSSATEFESKIPDWIPKYLDWSEDYMARLRAGEVKFALQPITDIHLHSNIRWELETNGSFSYLMIYGISALFILLVSIINFVNLNTARAAQRLKEVGVRKTLGAFRVQIFSQFIVEALLTTFLALMLSVFVMIWLEHPFNILVNGQIEVANLMDVDVLLFMVAIAIFTALVSALYPSLYLNSFEAGKILRGLNLTKLGGSGLRNGLLGVQLVVTILMISGSMMIRNQIQFLKSKDLGFDQDNLMIIDIGGQPFSNKIEVLKNALTAIPGISDASAVSNVPGGQFNQHPLYMESNPQLTVDASEMFVDEDVAITLNLEMADGRMLDDTFAADSAGTAFVLNETAIRELNVTDPVGKQLFWVNNEELVKGTIVGVVKDFHYNSLHVPIRPIIMMMNDNSSNYMLVKVNSSNIAETMKAVEAKFVEVVPEVDFKYQFLDSQIEELYQEEARTLKLTLLLAGISIFLACGGLLGIVSIVIKQRVKEISIRKVLGASISHILWLMNVKYMIITVIALMLAVPLSIYFIQTWLGNFTYQTAISPFVYSITAIGVVGLIAITISLISMGTIRSNPADSLRNE
ncbi:ABC transporter permease [Roseivirga sp.]|uniref:ABC transporter permease n=1 Tax=Roseivirga sp. TaxID=1964215 RepID=UPI003B5183CF